jgi:C1A family cysteine protease
VAQQSRGFGWIRDLPDQRDFLYAAAPETLQQLPPRVDLTGQCPPVYDQGQLGSCTANAIGAAHEFAQMKQGLPAPSPFTPSRLFIYYNERVIEHSVASDSGAQIRDGMKVVNNQGVCPEDEWPYDIAKFADQPPQTDYTDALNYTATSYQAVAQTLNQLKGCLFEGYPFVFGIVVYESFPMQTTTGDVPLPGPGEGGPDGGPPAGHAILAVGYDDAEQHFLFRNSWGTGWGNAGYGTLPYLYVTRPDLASDFWTLRLVK